MNILPSLFSKDSDKLARDVLCIGRINKRVDTFAGLTITRTQYSQSNNYEHHTNYFQKCFELGCRY